jgi:glycosyltransferase involved in cell wall biosynthesis
MIEGHDIICFCNDWSGDPLSKKQIVTRLAEHNRILWVNSTGNRNPTASAHDFQRAWKKLKEFGHGCRQVAENIHVFSPLVIPFHGSRAARAFNQRFYAACLRRACRKLHFRDPIVLTFVPSSADVIESLDAKLVIYYCVDEYSQFSGTNKEAILSMERKLMERSGLVIVSADRLLESKREYNPNTFLITHGVDVEHFRKACLANTEIPADCPRSDTPVIGFFGLIEDWVDLRLIRELAVARPTWSFVLIGEVRADASPVADLLNVHLLGRRTYGSLPAYCKAFDVAILPFTWNELTLAANPLKLREYLAAGLPVVATPLPEVRRLGKLVNLASTPAEYLEALDGLLASGRRGPRLADSLRMDAESWDCKVEQLSQHIEESLAGEVTQQTMAMVST